MGLGNNKIKAEFKTLLIELKIDWMGKKVERGRLVGKLWELSRKWEGKEIRQIVKNGEEATDKIYISTEEQQNFATKNGFGEGGGQANQK